MENAQYFQADDNAFSAAFADSYLQEPNNLQQVYPADIQDQHFNQFQQEFPTNEQQSFMEMLPPPPPQESKHSNNEPDEELTSEQLDDIEINQFAPKTRKQTLWGVKKFKSK